MESGDKVVRKTGRKDAKSHKEMIEKLQEYFDDGKSVLYTAKMTGYDKKTVGIYYKEFRDILIETMDENFINVQKASKVNGMKKLEENIAEVEALMKILFSKTDDAKGGVDYQLYLKCIEVKSNLEQQRYAVEASPTADIRVEKEIQKEMEKVNGATKPISTSS